MTENEIMFSLRREEGIGLVMGKKIAELSDGKYTVALAILNVIMESSNEDS